MQPTLRQFEVFLAVAKAGSFRVAAEAMHLSQPALSQHVAEMERELGARLFDRLGRKVALTEAGRILEEHALRLFASVTSAREAVADLSELKRGSLVIGAIPLLVGLAIVLPVLGHATWHLYRKVVVPDLAPREVQPAAPQVERYAADFPSVLFTGWSKRPRE